MVKVEPRQDTIKGEGVVINESEHLLASLDQRMHNLHQLRPLPSETSRSLADALRVRITYTSNAIEGNHLTLAETQVVLEGITVGGKPLRDHLEAIDHAEAWDAMILWSQSDQPLTPWLLRSLHALVLCRSQPGEAGHYREVPVAISGSTLIPPDPLSVPGEVDDLFAQWHQSEGHPVAIGAEMHARLMAIHPFADGNGRTGRLLLNLWLLRHEYLPALIEPTDRLQYYAALSSADRGDTNPIIQVVADGVALTLTVYEEVLHLSHVAKPPHSHL